jgi:hypothetical protein
LSVLNRHGLGHLRPLVNGPVPARKLNRWSSDLKKASRLLNREEFLIERRRADGTYGLAKPCAECHSMLLRFGVTRVTYSTPDGFVTENTKDMTTFLTGTRRQNGRADLM